MDVVQRRQLVSLGGEHAKGIGRYARSFESEVIMEALQLLAGKPTGQVRRVRPVGHGIEHRFRPIEALHVVAGFEQWQRKKARATRAVEDAPGDAFKLRGVERAVVLQPVSTITFHHLIVDQRPKRALVVFHTWWFVMSSSSWWQLLTSLFMKRMARRLAVSVINVFLTANSCRCQRARRRTLL